MKGIINFYTNNDNVKKTFLGWEDTLNVEASTYKLLAGTNIKIYSND